MESVTLDTIGGGALAELFGAELDRILANIADPNTDAVAKRQITIVASFKPNKDRDIADVELKCNSKLAGIMTVSTRLFMGKQRGKLVAVESDPKQSGLFDQEKRPLAAVGQFPKEGE